MLFPINLLGLRKQYVVTTMPVEEYPHCIDRPLNYSALQHRVSLVHVLGYSVVPGGTHFLASAVGPGVR